MFDMMTPKVHPLLNLAVRLELKGLNYEACLLVITG